MVVKVTDATVKESKERFTSDYVAGHMNRFVNMEKLEHSAVLKLTARALLWFLCESTLSTCFVLTLSIVGLRM